MNQKIQKIITEIEKTKEKIKELQTLLPELEKQKIDLENTEIIGLIRSAKIAPENFTEFLQAYKSHEIPNKSNNLNQQEV